MQGDTSSWVCPRISISSLRSICAAFVLIAVFVLFIWMYTEQNHVQRCTELASSNTNPQSTRDVPIQVVVQMPPGLQRDNKTQDEVKVQGRKWDYNWDMKHWTNPEDAQGVPMRTIILVRHGQYDLNTGHLNERGRQQANLTGIRLKDLGMAYDRIIHSTMDRAIETAHLLHAHLPHLPISSDDMIEEAGPIPPEPTVSYWGLPERTYFLDGPRVEAAFRKYFYRADKTQTKETIDILVGHGNIFRFFLLRALQFPPDAWMTVFIAHASISLVHINADGTVAVTKFGDSGHFPSADMITF